MPGPRDVPVSGDPFPVSPCSLFLPPHGGPSHFKKKPMRAALARDPPSERSFTGPTRGEVPTAGVGHRSKTGEQDRDEAPTGDRSGNRGAGVRARSETGGDRRRTECRRGHNVPSITKPHRIRADPETPPDGSHAVSFRTNVHGVRKRHWAVLQRQTVPTACNPARVKRPQAGELTAAKCLHTRGHISGSPPRSSPSRFRDS